MAKKKASKRKGQADNGSDDAYQSNLAAWRKSRAGGAYELPSGLNVTLKYVGLFDLVLMGNVPTSLDPLVDELTQQGMNAKDFQKYVEVINLVCVACIQQPHCVLDAVEYEEARQAHEEVLIVGEMPVDDRLAIFTWALAKQGDLRPFRAKSQSDI